jgi:hypothetical protein
MLYLPSYICSVWAGSAFCVMRTSLGTPRAGALLYFPCLFPVTTLAERSAPSLSFRSPLWTVAGQNGVGTEVLTQTK